MLEYEECLNPSYMFPKNRLEQVLGSCLFYLGKERYRVSIRDNSLTFTIESAILTSFMEGCSTYHDNILRKAYDDVKHGCPILDSMNPYTE